jgi:heterotetrameric sarcosine oxidase gamma subunit
VTVRFDALDAEVIALIATHTGLHLRDSVRVAHGDRSTALWLGPGEWRITAGDDSGAIHGGDAVDDHHGAGSAARLHPFALLDAAIPRCLVVDTSDAWIAVRLLGPHSRDVLGMGCAIDLDAADIGDEAASWVTRFARIRALIHRVSTTPSIYDVHVERSYAAYAWSWLTDAMTEFLHERERA